MTLNLENKLNLFLINYEIEKNFRITDKLMKVKKNNFSEGLIFYKDTIKNKKNLNF